MVAPKKMGSGSDTQYRLKSFWCSFLQKAAKKVYLCKNKNKRKKLWAH
jgi:hypothetical protein